MTRLKGPHVLILGTLATLGALWLGAKVMALYLKIMEAMT